MFYLATLLINLFLIPVSTSYYSYLTYGVQYNYNGHSYLLSDWDVYIYYGYFYCKNDGHYAVDIQDQAENDAISSVIYRNRTLGVWRFGYGSNSYYSEHRSVLITYSNWDPSVDKSAHRYRTAVQMMGASGLWRSVYQWNKGYYICEDDKISPIGLNITSGKKINLPYDSMVSFRGHTYYIYKVARSFASARQICHFDHDGYVFIPNDGQENCAVHEIIYAASFVGITNNGRGKFITEKQYLASYLPWTSLNLLSQECVIRSYINGEFSTVDCTLGNHIICESDSVIPGATPKDCSYENQFNYFAQIFYFQNNSFYVFEFLSSRSQALDICAKRNAILYAPFNPQENCAVFENVEFDIGINYGSVFLDHVLMRGDSLDSNYSNWETTYPRDPQTNGCVYAKYSSGKWINDKCKNSRFICYANDDNYNYSNIACKNQFFHLKNQTYSRNIGGKYYSFFGKPLTYHDSSRLCAQFGLSLVQTTSNYIISQLNREIKNQRFFVDYRIFWNDTTLTWLDGTPSNPPWAPNEPFYNDDGIVCITVAQNGSFLATMCKEKHMAVCAGYHSAGFAKSMSGPSKKSLGMGFGIFFAIVAVILIVVGAFIFIRKKSFSMPNFRSSIGSFRRGRNTPSISE